MSNIKFIGDISHGEKYTRIAGLYKDEISGDYLVKALGQWLKVIPANSNKEK